jgi:hypothetical protein
VGQGLIHGHPRFAVASQSPTVAERHVEGFTEGAHHVFDRVMIAGLQVTHSLDAKVHAAVKGQLLEHVIIKSQAGVHVDPTLARHAQSNAEQRLGGVSLEAKCWARHRRIEQYGSQRV